eukprot:9122198-Ditylum_brightwellii.AAC.1
MGQSEELVADDFHTWGCLDFVLDATLQNSTGIGQPKWDPRSRAGVYLGHSPVYVGNVALVLNLQTGHMSPQYHIIFDDEFITVPYLDSDEPPPNWTDLIKNHTESATEEAFNIVSSWYEGERNTTDLDEILSSTTPPTSSNFIDVNTIGLMRSKCI